jgi:hypothetical protein
MRTTLRIFGWFIKTVLLLIALAALVIWPVSRGKRMSVSGEHDVVQPTRGELREYSIRVEYARLYIGHRWYTYVDPKSLQWFREQAAARGKRWRFESRSQKLSIVAYDASKRWGPFGWYQFERMNSGSRSYSLPLWLVALVAGLWPAVSLAGFVVRGRRRRKAAREGLCERCGYDLRATPARGVPPFKPGELLAVCPECGHSEARSTKPESRKE